eukprot:g1229.t1
MMMMIRRISRCGGGGAVRRSAVRTFASSTEETLVTVERVHNGRVAIVRFNRPKSLNAMTVQMGDAFRKRIEELGKEKDLRACVLTGEGRAFSAGGDVDFLRARMADNALSNAREMVKFYNRYLCIRDLPVPTIAAINGHAIGAGMCVALACDMRVAAPQAKIGFTFSKLGLHPGMGATHFLPLICGPENASRMLLTGELVSGEDAKSLRIVGDVSKNPLEFAVARAIEIARTGPIAVQTCVRTLRKAQSRGLEDSLWREADAQSQCYNSSDMEEGVGAMMEKRTPEF